MTVDSKPPAGRQLRLFNPILAGATLRERAIACLGALIGIALTGWLSGLIVGNGPQLPLLVACVGSSSVLLFAVPASPLAQPWSIIGGNTLSALVAVLVVQFVHDPILAPGLAVCAAIAVMSLARCLHPPGGAAALSAVIGGPAVLAAGYVFPFVPVALNSALLVALGIVFHRLSRRAYPHRAPKPQPNLHNTLDTPPAQRVGFRSEDVDAALAALDETFDIDRNDLDVLLRRVEMAALTRTHGALLCQDIMSRDIIRVDNATSLEAARALLLDHNIRTLPVVDASDKLVGVVGLRELSQPGERVAQVLSHATTAAPTDPAASLLPALTSGTIHAVVIIDQNWKILGLVTQTDLLAAMTRLGDLPAKA
ncbi:MAG TPA: HPP family protein [Devosiaceae bacterium]|jgi:CBS domain-containing membrane protein